MERVKRVLPEKLAFPPTGDSQQPPIGKAPEKEKDAADKIGLHLENASKTSAKAMMVSFGVRDVGGEDKVGFSFQDERTGKSMSQTFTMSSGILWKNLVARAWKCDRDETRSGVFSQYTLDDYNTKILEFEIMGGNTGKQTMNFLKHETIQSIVQQAGSTRPIRVRVTMRKEEPLPLVEPPVSDNMFD